MRCRATPRFRTVASRHSPLLSDGFLRPLHKLLTRTGFLPFSFDVMVFVSEGGGEADRTQDKGFVKFQWVTGSLGQRNFLYRLLSVGCELHHALEY